MAKKCFTTAAKVIYFVLAFCIAFTVFQRLVIPKVALRNTAGYEKLERNSLDVLCLGASQMFCTVNAPMLTDEYQISTYNYGASGQPPVITSYYLQEALKTQHPKVVMIEVCEFLTPLSEVDDPCLDWNYDCMPLTKEKYHSSLAVSKMLGRDRSSIIRYFFPLFVLHSRWNGVDVEDMRYSLFLPSTYSDYSKCGYWPTDKVEQVEIEYLKNPAAGGGGGVLSEIPQETVAAACDMFNLCHRKGIDVVFFKAPEARWSQDESRIIKDFMNKNGFRFLEMNDYLDEMGIDSATDFRDSSHLNSSGAIKVTKFLAKYLENSVGLAK